MKVLLLYESSNSLELCSEWAAIRKEVTAHNANPLTLAKSIEKSSLASTRDTHQCYHDPRLSVAVHVIE